MGAHPSIWSTTVDLPFVFDLPEGMVETTATVDAGTCEIVSVRFGGLQLTPYQAEDALGRVEYARQCSLIERRLSEALPRILSDARIDARG